MKVLFNYHKGKSNENLLLALTWGAVIVTGFLALGAVVFGIESLIAFGRIHSLVVRVSLVYTAVHLFRHRKQLTAHTHYRKEVYS